jgi:hypothetical protein
MPDEKRQTINEEAGLPDNWVPLDSPTIIPSNIQKQNPDNSSSSSAPLVGSLPPTYQLDADFVRNAYRGQSVPNLSLMPLGVQGNPSTNAGIVSTSTKIVTQAISAIPPSPPAAAAVGDGLTHGDLVWEHDSAYVEHRDDFITGSNIINSPTGVGELGWFFGNSGSATSGNFLSYIPPNIGQFEFFQTGGTANTFGWLTPGNTNGNFPAFFDVATPFLDAPGWKLTWVFCFSRPMNPNFAGAAAFSLAKSSTYIGLAFRTAASSSPLFALARPSSFMGVRYDTDTTAPSIADTTFWLESFFNPMPNSTTRNNIQGTSGGAFNTSITPVEGVFYRLDMAYTALGSVTMTLSGGGQSATTTFTLTPMSMSYTPTQIPTNSNGVTNTHLTPTAFSTTDGYIPMVWGSIIAMTGWVSTNVPLNITTPVYQETNGAALFIPTPVGYTTPSATIPAVTVVGYPALFPVAIHGNDSQGTAPNTGRSLVVDFFSLVWNPNLGSSAPGTPDPTKARYW